MCVCVCVSVCLVSCNLGGYFILLVVESMVGKNTNTSNKKIMAIFGKTSSLQRNGCVKPQ